MIYLIKMTNEFKKSGLNISLFLILSSCSSLNLTTSLAEIEAPTASAPTRSIGVEFSAIGGKELILVDDPSRRPVVYNSSQLKTAAAFLTRAGIVWHPFSRIRLTGGIQNSSAAYAKAKISLIGNLGDESLSHAYFLTTNFETTYQVSTKTGDLNGATGASGYPWSGTTQNISGTGGVSLGYKFFKNSIVFIGYNYQKFQTTGNITHSASKNGLDAGAQYNLKLATGIVNNIGFGIEYKHKARFVITPVIQYYDFNWAGNNIQDVTGSVRMNFFLP